MAAGVCRLGGAAGRRGAADVAADERREGGSAICHKDGAAGQPRQSSPRTDGRGGMLPQRSNGKDITSDGSPARAKIEISGMILDVFVSAS